MTTLNDIPVITDNIKGASLKTIKAFYKLIFESDGDRNSRKRVREFSGFTFDSDSDEYAQKLEYIDANFSISDLSVISNILKVDHDVDKTDLIKTICDKLMNLQDLKKVIESDEEKEEEEEEEEVVAAIEDRGDATSQISSVNASHYQLPTFSMSLRDMEESIRPFDGTDAFPIEKWISDLEDLATIFGWTELQKFVVARKSLKGLAKLYIQSETKINSYYTLKKALLKEFSSTFTSAQVHQMLGKRKIGKNESVEEYFLKMKELANRSQIEDASLIQYVIDGITDDVRNKMILFGCTTIPEFKHKLKVYKEMTSKIEQRSQPEKNQTYAGAKPKTREATHKPEDRPIRCYNCGGRGHVSRNCNNREKGVKCFTCQKFGHKANECTEKSEKPVCLTESRKHNGTYVQVKLNEHVINALIDTGSSVSLIKATEYLKSNSTPLDKTAIKLNGIGANIIETLGSCKTSIQINDIIGEIELHVVTDVAMPPPMVIGRDFLKDYEVNINAGELKTLTKIARPSEQDENDIELCMQVDLQSEDEICIENDEYNKEIENLIEEYVPSNNPTDTGIRMKIILTDEVPIYQRARRLAPNELSEVEQVIDEWKQNGVIRPSVSDFASAVVPVKKKNGSTRVCVDYRQLNRKTVKDRFPLPIIDDQLDRLRDAKIFTTLDLRNGFHHVRVDEESVKYTAFVTPRGHYEFLRMPFGLCNAPAKFQRFIIKVFEDLINQGILLIYIDDLIIPAKENEEAIFRLKIVLQRAAEFGIQFNWKKCRFMKRNDRYDVQKVGTSEGPKQTSTAADFMKPWSTSESDLTSGDDEESAADLEDEMPVRKGRDVGSREKRRRGAERADELGE